MTNALTRHLKFLRAGLLQHGQTGGIVPSQRFLIARMIAPVPEDYQGQVVELGAGSGALTLLLATRCPKARILACEINPTLARTAIDRMAQKGCDGRVQVVSASAGHLLSELGRPGMTRPDFIISGVPLGNLSPGEVGRLLDSIRRVLSPDGMYIQFQHSLMDWKAIQTRFPRTRTVPVLLNFPPAYVYYAQAGT